MGSVSRTDGSGHMVTGRVRALVRSVVERRRTGAERGATLVEYALVTSLLVGVSIGAIQFLTDRSDEATKQQAACISERPPPPGCQIPTAVPPSVFSPPAGDPPELIFETDTASYRVGAPDYELLTEANRPEPVKGAEITFALEVAYEDPETGEVVWELLEELSCITGDEGKCEPPPEFVFEITEDDNMVLPTKARVTVIDVQPNPPSQFPPEVVYDLPADEP